MTSYLRTNNMVFVLKTEKSLNTHLYESQDVVLKEIWLFYVKLIWKNN